MNSYTIRRGLVSPKYWFALIEDEDLRRGFAQGHSAQECVNAVIQDAGGKPFLLEVCK